MILFRLDLLFCDAKPRTAFGVFYGKTSIYIAVELCCRDHYHRGNVNLYITSLWEILVVIFLS